MSYKDPNDLLKVQTITAPIWSPSSIPTAQTPGYIPTITSNPSGGGIWQTIGNIVNIATKYVAPLITKRDYDRQIQLVASNPHLQNYGLPQQAPQRQVLPQQFRPAIPQRKTITDYITENPLVSGGVVVGVVALGAYLIKSKK